MYSFRNISDFRSPLMGFSILLIMVFHCLYGWQPIMFGNIGVEFFLLLSAIGMYFSEQKNHYTTIGFYKRRILRILPAYLIISIPYYCYTIGLEHPMSIIKHGIGLSTYLNGDRSFWFIHLILLCYLLTPFYFQYAKSRRCRLALLPISLGIFFVLSLYLKEAEILFMRVPCYLLGLYFAEFVYESKATKKTIVSIIGTLALVLVVLTPYLDIEWIYKRFIYFFLCIPSLIAIQSIVSLLPKKIIKALSFIGTLTLELYLVHEKIILPFISSIMSQYLAIPTSIVLALVVAYFLHYVGIKKRETTKTSLYKHS